MTNKKSKPRSHRHAFRFKSEFGKTIITAWATVRPATRNVPLDLEDVHVRRSLKLHGQGNTQKCAMAICSRAHGHAFDHPVLYIDWLDSKAFVVTKTKNGLPSECVVYDHNDIVAKQFDTKAGLTILLAELEKNGPKRINLLIPREHPKQPNKPTGNKTGERAHTIRMSGAKLRFARLQVGGVPNEESAAQ